MAYASNFFGGTTTRCTAITLGTLEDSTRCLRVFAVGHTATTVADGGALVSTAATVEDKTSTLACTAGRTGTSATGEKDANFSSTIR